MSDADHDANRYDDLGYFIAGSDTAAKIIEAVQQVQVLHSPRIFHGDGYGWSVCAECRQGWPCATAHAIDRCLGVERHANGNVKSGPKSWPFGVTDFRPVTP